jgi:23S rRNA pseudouridine955/2504/2580 synthase
VTAQDERPDQRSFPKVSIRIIGDGENGQRIDNYLVKVLKGVPKSRIYKAIRSGEVRINGGRVKAQSKIADGDKVRIPPIRVATESDPVVVPPKLLDSIPILFEDEYMLVVDKPAGLAVHGGTGIDYGLIEALRQLNKSEGFLELVHRLDRDTSGCLMLAKSREALLKLQAGLSNKSEVSKFYQALVMGHWKAKNQKVSASLLRVSEAGKEKRVTVSRDGQKSISIVNSMRFFEDSTLVRVELKTGRMHQARVHCSHQRHPIVGDRFYGDEGFNLQVKKLGLGRMFLHASRLIITHPINSKLIDIECKLPEQLTKVLNRLQPL